MATTYPPITVPTTLPSTTPNPTPPTPRFRLFPGAEQERTLGSIPSKFPYIKLQPPLPTKQFKHCRVTGWKGDGVAVRSKHLGVPTVVDSDIDSNGGGSRMFGGEDVVVSSPRWTVSIQVPVCGCEEERGTETVTAEVSVHCVLDGHGGKKTCSAVSRNILERSRHLLETTLLPSIYRRSRLGDFDHIHDEEEAVSKMVREMDDEFGEEDDGCTLTWWAFIYMEGRFFIPFFNLGDSPLYLLHPRSGKTVSLYDSHTWEEPRQREAHIRRCKAQGIIPVPEIVYGRVNCTYGSMQIPDREGHFEPIPIYVGETSEIDKGNRDYFVGYMKSRKRMVGGSQSLSAKEVVQRWDTTRQLWVADHVEEDIAHRNWGSTVLYRDPQPIVKSDSWSGERREVFIKSGKIQMSNSMGDKVDKRTVGLGNEPSFGLVELGSMTEDEEVGYSEFVVVGMSDGIGDVYRSTELAQKIKTYRSLYPSLSDETLARNILEDASALGRNTFGNPCHGTQSHDDLSIHLTTLYLSMM